LELGVGVLLIAVYGGYFEQRQGSFSWAFCSSPRRVVAAS